MTINKPARLSQQLSIEYPIIQVPLYHGGSTELVAEVSNSGGLGMIAGGFLTAEALQHEISSIKELTDRPFGVNLMISKSRDIPESLYADAISRMKGFASAELLEIENLNTDAWELSPLDDLLEVILDEEVPVVSFTFGIPSKETIALLKEAGVKIIGHSTHMVEALLWEESGVDVHLLQGSESGGMRHTFIGDVRTHAFSAQALTTQGARLLEKPFAVSGGIYNKSLFAAAIIQGADGVGIGTAFMLTPESGLSEQEAELLLKSNEYDSVLTEHWTGVLGRCYSNLGTQQLRKVRGRTLPFPEQLFLVHAATIDELEMGDHPVDFQPIWASVNAPFCERVSVKRLMESLVS
ncbi:putative nitronate monooxygenase [Ignatzschineria indica]|uniref:Propionate 3-nitronate monooxygenase n=1 Tax=Ignatzschineria indica TaxID=472583 RepID=A0A2U2ANY8_9GAMM|nr:nitronate monooxygenase [Ignatzschineria indica]PWD84846.1 nitronate monooxygenase [Ignatzschineria indica]GGZ79576.1 putative nitronate monooxygenase [Ignatzschineria indica]